MRLSDLAGTLLLDTWRTWRRRAIAGAIVFVCGIAALVEGISAARLALTPSAGPLGARLILVAVFALIIAAAVGWMVRSERREATAARAESDRPFGGDDKVTAIAEAIHLGYGLARDLRDWRAGKGAAAEAASPAAANGTDSGGKPGSEAEAEAAASVRDRP